MVKNTETNKLAVGDCAELSRSTSKFPNSLLAYVYIQKLQHQGHCFSLEIKQVPCISVHLKTVQSRGGSTRGPPSNSYLFLKDALSLTELTGLTQEHQMTFILPCQV